MEVKTIGCQKEMVSKHILNYYIYTDNRCLMLLFQRCIFILVSGYFVYIILQFLLKLFDILYKSR